MVQIHQRHLGGIHQSADQCGYKQKNGGFFHQRYGRRVTTDRDVSHYSLYLEHHPKGCEEKVASYRRSLVDDEIRRHRFFLIRHRQKMPEILLGITTITQDVGDFLASPYGIPIITNSSIQLLLKQSPATIDIVQKTFNLTDEEKYLLLESDVGEGIFFAGLKHVAIKILVLLHRRPNHHFRPYQLILSKKPKRNIIWYQQ